MGYRQLQGFAQSFLGKLLSTAVPNFRTICYRFKFEGELPDDAIIIIDSTGMKVTNRGEWIRMRGILKRRVSIRRGRRGIIGKCKQSILTCFIIFGLCKRNFWNLRIE